MSNEAPAQPPAEPLPLPTMGGCWIRQPDGSLAADPDEPLPPALRDQQPQQPDLGTQHANEE